DTWEQVAAGITGDTAGNGSFDWLVSGPAASGARIRITPADDPDAGDAQEISFAIVDPVIEMKPQASDEIWRLGQVRQVTFTHNLGKGQPIDVALSRDGGATWTALGTVVT